MDRGSFLGDWLQFYGGCLGEGLSKGGRVQMLHASRYCCRPCYIMCPSSGYLMDMETDHLRTGNPCKHIGSAARQIYGGTVKGDSRAGLVGTCDKENLSSSR